MLFKNFSIHPRANDASGQNPGQKIRKEIKEEWTTKLTHKEKVKMKKKIEKKDEELILADRLADMCLMRCEICSGVVKRLRCHVKTKHLLSPAEYRYFYPQPVSYERKTFHRY